jgi:phage terminase small subunit
MMTNDDVLRAIREGTEAKSRRNQLSQDKVLQELAVIAFAKVTDFIEWDSHGIRIKPSSEIPHALHGAVRNICLSAKGKDEFRICMHDKIRSLELLGQHLNMFNGARDEAEEKKASADVLKRVSELIVRRKNRKQVSPNSDQSNV